MTSYPPFPVAGDGGHGRIVRQLDGRGIVVALDSHGGRRGRFARCNDRTQLPAAKPAPDDAVVYVAFRAQHAAHLFGGGSVELAHNVALVTGDRPPGRRIRIAVHPRQRGGELALADASVLDVETGAGGKGYGIVNAWGVDVDAVDASFDRTVSEIRGQVQEAADIASARGKDRIAPRPTFATHAPGIGRRAGGEPVGHGCGPRTTCKTGSRRERSCRSRRST